MRDRGRQAVLVAAGAETLFYVWALAGDRLVREPVWSNAQGTSASRVVAVLALLATGWAFVAAGLTVTARDPRNPIGVLASACGLSWPLLGLSGVDQPLIYTLGNLAPALFLFTYVRLLATFPDGRVTGRLQRLTVAISTVAVPLIIIGTEMLISPADAGCDCPPSLLLVTADFPGRPLAYPLLTAASVAVIALVVATIVVQWRRAPSSRRRAVAPAFVGAVVAPVMFAAANLDTLVDRSGTSQLGTIAVSLVIIGLGWWPLGLLFGMARVHWDRAAIADLTVALAGPVTPGGVQRALASALRDPGLRLYYWLPDRQAYVDVDGQAVSPETWTGSATSLESDDGRQIAVVVHQRGPHDSRLVRAALAAARLSIENERLHADLKAQLHEVVLSRARIVEAAGASRRQIERDLHDGAQQRLVNLAMVLRLARLQLDRGEAATVVVGSLDEAATEVTRALDELRDIARGIHPAVLTNAGLATALESLRETAPLPVSVLGVPAARLPQPVEETVYYVACEAITNAAKHARARRVQLRVESGDGEVVLTVADDGRGGADPDGSGLRGLSDRVSAVGGRLSVHSTPGEGTHIEARLPVAVSRDQSSPQVARTT